MFFVFSKILEFIIAPLMWSVVLFSIALIAKNKNRKRRCFVAGLAVLLFFTNPFIVNSVMKWWEVKPYGTNKLTRTYDVAIVLGGASRYYNPETNRLVYGNGVDRVIQAVELYQQKKVRKILLAGGSGYLFTQEIKEAELLKNMLLKMNIPDSDLIVERESRNTFENAKMSAVILKTNLYGKSYLIITSAFHVRRTAACFAKQGISADVFPVDEHAMDEAYTPDRIIVPDASALMTWDILIHEWTGLIIYKLSGYI